MTVRTLLIVTGPPGSGKSTLARALGASLGVPVIDKDVIKEAMFAVLGTGDRDWSRTLSRASFQVMLDVAAGIDAAVLVGNFSLDMAPGLAGLDPPPIEIFCRCPTDELIRRIRARRRHAGHLDDATATEVAAGVPSGRPLGLGGPLLELDTSTEVPVEAVVDWVRTAGV